MGANQDISIRRAFGFASPQGKGALQRICDWCQAVEVLFGKYRCWHNIQSLPTSFCQQVENVCRDCSLPTTNFTLYKLTKWMIQTKLVFQCIDGRGLWGCEWIWKRCLKVTAKGLEEFWGEGAARGMEEALSVFLCQGGKDFPEFVEGDAAARRPTLLHCLGNMNIFPG